MATVKQSESAGPTEPVTAEVSAPPRLYSHPLPSKLEPYYSAHVAAMTHEALHSKSEIAAELAFRDVEIVRLRRAVKVLYSVFDGAAKACELYWECTDSIVDAVNEMRPAVEAYRELVAPLGGLGSADPGKSVKQSESAVMDRWVTREVVS